MSQELDTNIPRDSADGASVPVHTAPAGTEGGSQRPLPPDAIAIVCMRNLVLFPGMILPAGVGRERSVAAAQEAIRSNRPVGLLLQRDPSVDSPKPDEVYSVGTVANVMRYVTTPDGGHHLVCQGEERFRVLEFLDGYPFLAARIERIPDHEVATPEMEARLIELRSRAQEVLELLPESPAELTNAIRGIGSASLLSDLVAGFMDLKPTEKQELLETFDVATRVDKVLKRLSHRIEVLQLSKKISDQTRESMEDRQREYLLREQMKTIQKELGESDETAQELEELAKAIDEAGMPEEVLAQARKELKRLQRMSENAAEYSMVRTYLDTMVELPWQKAS
jgi:ATP-dependent Lon protease